MPQAYNLTLTSADTEYSQALPPARTLVIQARTAVDVRIAFETGKVAGSTAPFYTLKSGSVLNIPVLNQAVGVLTLYVASAGTGVVLEVLAFLGE